LVKKIINDDNVSYCFQFVLKHDAFRSLREVESFPSSLCPSHSEAIPLVQAMLTQVINLHPNLTTLHIGADEVSKDLTKCTHYIIIRIILMFNILGVAHGIVCCL
jgi:hypothetical protein